MLRIELDDLSRPPVISLLAEHFRNMNELSPPDQVFAFDASRLRAPDVSFWTHGMANCCWAAQRSKSSHRRKARLSACQESTARSDRLVGRIV